MDNEQLQELLREVEKQGGGVVLHVGDMPAAVVLSVEKYRQLLDGVAQLGVNVSQEPARAHGNDAVLVTGGAGYIGSHTVRLLLESGWRVIVLDNLSTGRREFIPDAVTFYEGNVGDLNLLRDIFAQEQVTQVLHFAASLEVGESVDKPIEYFINNVTVTEQLLRAATEYGVRDFVLSSTAAVYGEQDVVPILESAPLRPNNPYGHTKLLAEQLVRYFSETTGMHGTVLRYFNVCGQMSAWGLSDTHAASHLLPVILEVARGERDHIVVNGRDFPTHDGTCVRDYVHVLDIARAHVAALDKRSPEPFRVYNIGTGKGFSVEEMIAAAAEITGRMIPITVGPRRSGDAAATVADAGKIKRELGFETRHSTLEEIIRSAWK